jgi:two-component system LytT family response regulator
MTAPTLTPTAPTQEATMIRAIIVDDEELGRDRIHALLEQQPDVEIVAVCADGQSAVETIEQAQPDLVFLDVQMPGMDGFEVIENLDSSKLPAVVFVTAHDGHAVRAFETHALDFLLKPFDQTRFEKALERARTQLAAKKTQATNGSPAFDSRLVSLLEELREERKYPERLIVKSSGRVFFVRTEDIDWVEASGNYVKIHTKSEAHLLRESMKNMEAKLDPKIFVRIHRSAIVNIDRIKELEPWFHGEYIVIMRDGTRLTASRVFSDRLSALIA